MKSNSFFSVEKLVRKNILEMAAYSSARDEFSAAKKSTMFLDANENPFPNNFNRYPDPQQKKLKEVLAKKQGLQPTQILLGNGSDEVLDLLFRAFCEPNCDNVITLEPTYGMYAVLAQINAIENRKVSLEKDFQPDLSRVLKNVDKQTKIIVVCSPNNPTGNIISVKFIENLLQEFSGLVVIDEAYIQFSDQASWLNRLTEFPNLVVVQTFSKAYGLAGIRLGVLYASAEAIALLHKIKPPYNINSFTQQKAVEVLANPEVLEEQLAVLKEEKNRLTEALSKIKIVEKIYASDANFILIRVDNATKRYQELIDAGIVIRNRTNQVLLQNCLRISVGLPEENKKLIACLKKLEI